MFRANGGNGNQSILRYIQEKGTPPDRIDFLYSRLLQAHQFFAENRAALEADNFLPPDGTYMSGFVIAALYSFLFRMPWPPGRVPIPRVEQIVQLAREQENL